MVTNGTAESQVRAVAEAIDDVLRDAVRGAYLYGSAVTRGLKPASDLDFLVVLATPTTRAQRESLVAHLRPLSRRGERPEAWRPVELTIVVEADVRPLADHPRMDFQYGEWLRDELDAGEYEPREPYNPDVLVLLAQVLARSRVLIGREATELIDAVPRDRLAAAMVAGIDGLLGDLLSDTANVLLTLARIWTTLETEEFVTKDEAADRAIARLPRPARPALVHARVVYVGEVEDEWNGKEVSATAAAEALAGAIRAHERV